MDSTRVTLLLLAAAFAAALVVDLPSLLSSQTDRQASAYVPAADKWIYLATTGAEAETASERSWSVPETGSDQQS